MDNRVNFPVVGDIVKCARNSSEYEVVQLGAGRYKDLVVYMEVSGDREVYCKPINEFLAELSEEEKLRLKQRFLFERIIDACV